MMDLIGTRYGDQNQFEILSYTSGTRKVKGKYRVICHKCVDDSELFGDGCFELPTNSITNNISKCGCSLKYYWSESQNIVRVNRLCLSSGSHFNGWYGQYRGDKTYLNLTCKEGHTYTSCTLSKFLMKRGCPKCRDEKLRRSNTPEQTETINEFMKMGRFNKGTIFCKIDGKNWLYRCPICSKDTYTMNGLCSGIFKGIQTKMKSGQLSCRCGIWKGWTQQLREHQIEQLFSKDSDQKYTFNSWVDNTCDDHSKVNIFCKDHGEFTISLGSLVYNGSRCSLCSNRGYNKNKPAVFYILKIDGATSSFVGYGISGDIKTRLKVHRINLEKHGYKVTDNFLIEDSGRLILNLETSVKNKFPRYSQNIEGFKNEATYYSEYDNLIKYAVNYTKEKT